MAKQFDFIFLIFMYICCDEFIYFTCEYYVQTLIRLKIPRDEILVRSDKLCLHLQWQFLQTPIREIIPQERHFLKRLFFFVVFLTNNLLHSIQYNTNTAVLHSSKYSWEYLFWGLVEAAREYYDAWLHPNASCWVHTKDILKHSSYAAYRLYG